MRLKRIARGALAGAMVGMGVLHLAAPRPFEAIMPAYLPAHRPLVYLSGLAEIAGGAGLLIPRWRRLAAWWLVALYAAVFPANLNMAIHEIPLGPVRSPALLWARLPLQLVFMAWAWWCGNDEPV